MKAHNNRMLWYQKPASYWEEALPIGNGRLGAMVFGGVAEDVFQMNEDTFWSGYPKKNEIADGPEHYRKARELTLAGKNKDAEREVEQYLEGSYTDAYLPLGDISLEFPGLRGKDVTEYERFLCLRDARSGSEFVCDGVKYRKEAFVSWPDQAMFVKIEADKAAALEFGVKLSSQVKSSCTNEGAELVLTGEAPGYAAPSYLKVEDPIRYGETDAEKGMRFCMKLAVETDGEITGCSIPAGDSGTAGCSGAAEYSGTAENGLWIRNASYAILRITSATSFNGYDKHPYLEGKDEIACCEANLTGAKAVSYEEAQKRHIEDYRSYFERLDLRFTAENAGQNPDSREILIGERPTDERLASFYQEGSDLKLYELFFHYSRYLMISSSRPGTLATNLQGIWNTHLRAPWSSNYTININTEMNYWPAEPCGFGDLHEPLFELVEILGKTGAKTAQMVYGAGGFVSHHNTDIWGLSTPVGEKGAGTAGYAFWPMSAGWLCRHLFEHYEYTLDREFLKNRAYPLLRSAAQFYLDLLVPNADGKLILAPMTSPENRYQKGEFRGAVAQSCAMAQSIIAEVFDECLACAQILGDGRETEEWKQSTGSEEVSGQKTKAAQKSECWIENLREKRAQLMEIQIGSDGRIMEWSEELPEPEVQHRHISHLYALYPGVSITPEKTPELAEACRRSLEVRGDVGTGWSLGWKVNTWARLQDGDHALKILREQMRFVEPDGARQINYSNGGGTYPNLFDAHPPFQIDGNFGTLAGITELFLQSTAEEIHLLPALPAQFANVQVKGICARGRVKADLCVRNGKLAEAVLTTDHAQERVIVYGDQRRRVKLEAGVPFCFAENMI